MFVIVFKFGCYFCPQRMEFLYVLIVHILICTNPAVVMYVDDTVQILANTVIHNLMNTFHPHFAYITFRIHVILPSDRKTNCIEASVLYSGNHFLRSLWITPRCFVSKVPACITGAVERVAQVPAGNEVVYR